MNALAEAAAYGDVALQAEGYEGAKADKLGVFERQEGGVVQKRPVYKKQGEELFLFYDTNGNWVVGPDTSKTEGWWKATSTARTPGAITEPWTVADGGDWPEVPAAKIIKATAAVKAALAAAEAEAAAAALAEAVAYGDVALQAEGYTGAKAGMLGVFERQEEVVNGRPAYKKEEEEHFLFYATDGEWTVGSDTSKTAGWWKATSSARTPGAITEPWTVAVANGGWVEVPSAKIIKATAAC